MRSVRLLALCAASMLLVNCGDDDEGGGTAVEGEGEGAEGEEGEGEGAAVCPEIPAQFKPECPIDSLAAALPPLPEEGGPPGASAGVVTEDGPDSQLIGGLSSAGRVGDYYMANSKIRLVIQKPGRVWGAGANGGQIIDADLVRPGAEPDNSHFGELIPWFNLGHTVVVREMEVLRDGSAGGPAVIRGTGIVDILDFLNVFAASADGAPDITGILVCDIDEDFKGKGWEAAVTYTLEPGTSSVHVSWSFYNPTDENKGQVGQGFYVDTGGEIEIFSPGNGFGEGSLVDAFYGRVVATTHTAYQGPGIAYGVVPELQPAGDRCRFPTMYAVALSGLSLAPMNVSSFFEAAGCSGFGVGPHCGATYSVSFLVGRDLGAVQDEMHRVRGLEVGTVSGRVLDDAGEAVGGARVAALAADTGNVFTIYVTDSEGGFGGTLPPGAYKLQADKTGWPRSLEADVTVEAGELASANLEMGRPGTLEYKVTLGGRTPTGCKVSVVGTDPSPPDKRFRDVSKDGLRQDGEHKGLVRAVVTSVCDSAAEGTGVAGPIAVEPGSYRVVISKGIEFDVIDQVVEVVSGAATAAVTGELHRVLDTPGSIGGDFHQHAVHSWDAPVTHEDKLTAYLAEGVEFIGASEHEFVYDYQPLIEALGWEDQLTSMGGIELTTFDYGHFNIFPIEPDDSLNGGVIEWAGGEDGGSVPPGDLFQAYRDAGATMIQINHPRSTDAFTFQQYFDRAGLSFDFGGGGSAVGRPDLAPIDRVTLRLPPDSDVFHPGFDTLEVYNGFSIGPDADGRPTDRRVERVVKDWFNFLSTGKRLTGLGNSDSHNLVRDPNGFPRTYVDVETDQAGAEGLGEAVVQALLEGKASFTNGPYVVATATSGEGSAGHGDTLTVADGALTLTVRVQAPTWAPFDRIEVFHTQSYLTQPNPPHVCGALEEDECSDFRMCVDGECVAEDFGPDESLDVRPGVVEIRGGGSRLEVEETFELTAEEDGWLIVRVTGVTPLFPVLPNQAVWAEGADPVTDAPESGVYSLAFTNAIYLEADGEEGWAPPHIPAP